VEQLNAAESDPASTPAPDTGSDGLATDVSRGSSVTSDSDILESLTDERPVVVGGDEHDVSMTSHD